MKISSFSYSLSVLLTCPRIKFLFSKAHSGGPVLLWLLQEGVGVPMSVWGASLSYLGHWSYYHEAAFCVLHWNVSLCVYTYKSAGNTMEFFWICAERMCFSYCLRAVFPEFCYLTILSSSFEPNLSINAYRYCLFGRIGFLLWHDLLMRAVRSPLRLLFSSLNRASPLRSSLHFFKQLHMHLRCTP